MKTSIGTKITGSLVIVLLLTFIITGGIFHYGIKQYIIREAQNELLEQGKLIDITVNRRIIPIKRPLSKEQGGPEEPRPVLLINRLIKAEYAVLDFNGRVLLSNNPILLPKGKTVPGIVERTRRGVIREVLDFGGREFVLVSVPANIENIRNPQNTRSLEKASAVILFTELKQLTIISKTLSIRVLRGLLLASLLTLPVGMILGRSISKPIKELQKAVKLMAKHRFNPPLQLNTRDELQDLAEAFNSMSCELREYYYSHKSFLQNASHELKTPLMSIQGYAEGILDEVFTGEQEKKALMVIAEESQRLKGLVDQIIYLSKLETMPDNLKFERLNIRNMIIKAIEKVGSLAIQRGITLNCQGDSDTLILVDQDKFIQALINIIGNAVWFAQKEVTVSVTEDNNYIEIIVKDDGEGFAAGEEERVFERFYTGNKGNTGLGLNIAKVIIEQHGGQIKAINNELGGALFCIRMKKGESRDE